MQHWSSLWLATHREDLSPATRFRPMSPYKFDRKGGPLAGQRAAVSDTEVRVAVVREGGALYLTPAHQTTPRDQSHTIGHYGFNHREESFVWFPAIR